MPLNRVLITGASSGLGKELAFIFAQNKTDLLLCGRNKATLEDIKNTIQLKYDISCLIFSGDLTNKKSFNDLINYSKTNSVDTIINNAALLCIGKKLNELSDDYIDNIIELNYKIPIKLIKNMYDQLNNIININSLAGLNPKKNRTLYCSTKSALKMFSETLSLETDKHILDVYISKLKKEPTDFGLDMSYVSSSIYRSFINNERNLLIDGK
jgi:short-subunit dehydrogenase